MEFDDDIFAAGNCYDQYQYKDYWLFCPYAYRLPEGTILVKDLAVEYKYLSNTSEWFYIARKNAEKVIKNYNQFSRGECRKNLLFSLLFNFVLFPPFILDQITDSPTLLFALPSVSFLCRRTLRRDV